MVRKKKLKEKWIVAKKKKAHDGSSTKYFKRRRMVKERWIVSRVNKGPNKAANVQQDSFQERVSSQEENRRDSDTLAQESEKVKSEKVKSGKVKSKEDMTMSMILKYTRFANVPQPEKKAKKAKSYKNTPQGKDEFLEIKDYPVFPSEFFKERFRNVEVFQEFYLPMLASVNPHLPPFALRYLCKIKHRDIFQSG